MSTLLVIFCVLIAAASWLGGWLPNLFSLGHRQTQMVLSLVSGVMLGVALMHLLPHSIEYLDDEKTAMMATLVGLLFMFFMIRMFHFHVHDPAEEDHDCDHHDHEHEINLKNVSWIGLAFGFSVHTIFDGITLAAAVRSSEAQSSIVLGVGVFLAILLHKPLDALAVTSLMSNKGWARKHIQWVNLGFALMCPIVAILFYVLVGSIGDVSRYTFGIALGFSAGVFLCISLSDLLPEVQFHSHDRLAMSGMLLLGVAMALGVALLG